MYLPRFYLAPPGYLPFYLVPSTVEARRIKSTLVKEATLIALVGVD